MIEGGGLIQIDQDRCPKCSVGPGTASFEAQRASITQGEDPRAISGRGPELAVPVLTEGKGGKRKG